MTIDEAIACVKKANPKAIFAVVKNGDQLGIIYDVAHPGEKPTLKDCEAVLATVQAEMAAVQAATDKEVLIQAKIREMAVDKLVEEGTLTVDEKAVLVSVEAVTK